MPKQHCDMCRPDMPVLTTAEISQRLTTTADWQYNEATHCIERLFQFKGFCRTMAFVNAIAWISHQQKHHPDITFGYDYVKVSYQTHAAGGITDNDFICAREVNVLV